MGSMFWGVSRLSRRPVVAFRKEGLWTDNMFLFYSNRKQAARWLTRAVELGGALEIPLTGYQAGAPRRQDAREDEWQELLEHQHSPARFESRRASEVLEKEANNPGSEFPLESLLSFDRGFCRRLWFLQPCRLVEQLIRNPHHSIFLWPKCN